MPTFSLSFAKYKMSKSYSINSNLGIDWCPRKGNWSVINFANFFSTCFLLRWKYVLFYAIGVRRIKTILEKNTAILGRKIETFSRNKMNCICFCHYFSHAYSLAIKYWASGRRRKIMANNLSYLFQNKHMVKTYFFTYSLKGTMIRKI